MGTSLKNEFCASKKQGKNNNNNKKKGEKWYFNLERETWWNFKRWIRHLREKRKSAHDDNVTGQGETCWVQRRQLTSWLCYHISKLCDCLTTVLIHEKKMECVTVSWVGLKWHKFHTNPFCLVLRLALLCRCFPCRRIWTSQITSFAVFINSFGKWLCHLNHFTKFISFFAKNMWFHKFKLLIIALCF